MSAVREQAVEAGMRAYSSRHNRMNVDRVAAVVDAVEPIIRADERANLPERWTTVTAVVAVRAEVRERLREQVKALPTEQESNGSFTLIRRSEVLALLEGS